MITLMRKIPACLFLLLCLQQSNGQTVVPAQTELAVLAMLIVGIEFTESVSTAEPVQVPIAPLTVYELVEVGFTVGFTELELLLQV